MFSNTRMVYPDVSEVHQPLEQDEQNPRNLLPPTFAKDIVGLPPPQQDAFFSCTQTCMGEVSTLLPVSSPDIRSPAAVVPTLHYSAARIHSELFHKDKSVSSPNLAVLLKSSTQAYTG